MNPDNENVYITFWFAIVATFLIVAVTQIRSCEAVSDHEKTIQVEAQYRAFSACVKEHSADECKRGMP